MFFLLLSAAYFVNFAAFLGGGGGAGVDLGDIIGGGSGFHFSTFKDGTTHRLLEGSKDPVHQEIFSRVKDFILSNKEAPAKVLADSTLGVVMEGSAADYYVGKNCNLMSVGSLNDRSYALAFNSGSGGGNLAFNPWNRAVLTLLESGEIDRIKSKWWKHADCSGGVGGGGGGGGAPQPFCYWHLGNPTKHGRENLVWETAYIRHLIKHLSLSSRQMLVLVHRSSPASVSR